VLTGKSARFESIIVVITCRTLKGGKEVDMALVFPYLLFCYVVFLHWVGVCSVLLSDPPSH
jgi:hypothetical protein